MVGSRSQQYSAGWWLAGALVWALCAPPATAAGGAALSNRRLPSVRTETPPQIDGVLDDEAWQACGVNAPFTDHFTYSAEIDQTRAFICYDDEFIYFAFECLDSQPGRIVAREIVPDQGFGGEDWVMVAIDPFRTRRNDDINYFMINPLGTGTIRPAGGRANKREWKGAWKSAAKRNDIGWTVEAAVPWKILNYPSSNGSVTFGLNFMRQQERTRIISQWSNTGPQWRDELAGDWVEVQVPRRQFKTRLSLLPYTLPGYRGRHGVGFHGGLDARAQLTPELTAVGTINPDFSTVERTIAGVNFVRGERFVSDTRPFFLEGGDAFDVNVRGPGSWGRAFFSGRVPQFDVGAKVFGRLGANNVGFLTTVDPGNRTDVVGRVRHDMGPRSFVGGYLVQRLLPGDENSVIGINEDIRRGLWRVRSEFAASLGKDAGGSAAYSSIGWRGKHVRSEFGYTRVEPNFRAANGFVPFVDYQGPHLWTEVSSEWRKGPLRRAEVGFQTSYDVHMDGSFFRNLWQVYSWVETRSDWGFSAGWSGGRFEDERDNEFRVGVTRHPSNRFNRTSLNVSFGKRADKSILFLQPSVTRRIGGWDVAARASILTFSPNAAQYVFSISRDLDPHRAVGARIIIQDQFDRFNRREFRGFHYVLTYKVAGGQGRDTFLLIGDPLTFGRRTRTSVLYKVVWPM